MKLRRLSIAAAALLLAAFVAPPAAHPQPNAAPTRLAPFLDDGTIAVARLDVAGFDLGAAAERFVKLTGLGAKQVEPAQKAAREFLANLRRAGARELFAVVSLADLPQPGPFLLVPLEGGADGNAIQQTLAMLPTETTDTVGGMAFAGAKATRERLRGLKPAARPDLQMALAAVNGAPVQLVLVPGPDQRRIVAEMLPKLPAELGGGPGTILTRGVRWGAVGLEYNPKLVVRVVIQSEDAAAAHALSDVTGRALQWFSKGVEVEGPQFLPRFKDLVPALSPKTAGDRIVLTLDQDAPGLATTLPEMMAKIHLSQDRMQSANNLKQIALAWHNYASTNRDRFPAQANQSKDGKLLLSWRVHILPYIEEDALYKQFHLDEPWDSEHNKALITKMPAVYHCPAQKVGDGKTTYLAPRGEAGPKGPHYGVLGVRFQDVTDGVSNTVMVVETNDEAAVVWTKPDDLDVDPKQPLKGLLGHYEQGFYAALADGSVRMLPRTIKPETLLAFFTRDGGERIDDR